MKNHTVSRPAYVELDIGMFNGNGGIEQVLREANRLGAEGYKFVSVWHENHKLYPIALFEDQIERSEK